jgi:hypothetical protein
MTCSWFPCPEDDADSIRWEAEGWDPELLALRITQLGDAAVTIPWDRQLRNIWAYKFKQLTEEQRQDPNIAHDLTSWQLSAHSVLTLMGQDDDRAMAVAQDPPQIHPRCRAGTVDDALNPSNSNSSRHSNGHGKPSASRAPQTQPTQARRDRISPTQGHGCAFALRCRKTPTRRCFTAPSTPSATRTSSTRGGGCGHRRKTLPNNVTPQEAQRRLEALVRDYNAAVRRQINQTRLKTVFLFVPVGAGLAVDAFATGGMTNIFVGAGDRAYRWRQGTLPVLEGCRSTGEPSSRQRIARRWGVNTAGATAIPTL